MNDQDAVVWVCDQCREPIDGNDGFIGIGFDVIRTAITEQRGGEFDLTDLDDEDEPMWRVLHTECDPDPDYPCYDISVSRVTTRAQLLAWCAHLSTKSWLPYTDWLDVVGRAIGPVIL